MNGQAGDLSFEVSSMRLCLLGRDLEADCDIANRSGGRTVRVRPDWKRENIRRRVHASILAIQCANALSVRQEHRNFGRRL